MRKSVLAIRVEWPEDAKQGRDFRFPQDLDGAVNEWRIFDETLKRNAARQNGFQELVMKSTRGLARLRRVYSGLEEQGNIKAAMIHVQLERMRCACGA